jgi:hypothetical protein
MFSPCAPLKRKITWMGSPATALLNFGMLSTGAKKPQNLKMEHGHYAIAILGCAGAEGVNAHTLPVCCR